MKNYSLKDVIEKEVHYKETQTPTNEFRMRGVSTIEHWGEGSGSGSIEMDEVIFQANQLTKAVMYANINDGQFGCQAINSAKVTVEQKIKVKRVYVDEDSIFYDDNSVELEQWETIVENLYVSRAKNFDEKVGDPLKCAGRGGYEYKDIC